MQCKSCSAAITDGSRFCPSCGVAQDVPVSKPNPVPAEPLSEASNATPEISKSQPEMPDDYPPEADIFSPQPEAAPADKQKFFAGYKNFGSLSAKSKILHIAVPAVCLLILISVFNGGLFKNYKNDSELAMGCAVVQIKTQTYSRYEPDVYDVELVDSDGCGRFIITASTGDNQYFPTRWAVIVQLNSDGETYNAVANYHGDGIGQGDWIEAYRTQSEYSWGVEQE